MTKQAEYSRRYRERYPERVRETANRSARERTARMTPEERWARWLWHAHKLRPGEYEQMWDRQAGLCYLCADPLERGKVHVEHNHECCPSGRSCVLCRRGLSCRGCNWILAWCGEDMAKLRRIADNFESLPR
jgi:hypothetical protein